MVAKFLQVEVLPTVGTWRGSFTATGITLPMRPGDVLFSDFGDLLPVSR